MTMMVSEARSIARAAAELRSRQEPFLVATVVRVLGSSYRRPGARLLATHEKRVAGSVSGGCLERDLLRTGFWRTRSGPVVVRYDSSDPEDIGDVALGCGGVVDVLLERDCFAPEDVASEKPTAMATVFRSTVNSIPIGTRVHYGAADSLGLPGFESQLITDFKQTLQSGDASSVHYATKDGGAIDLLVEAIIPPPHLFVFGAGLDAIPVIENARRLGWAASVWDPMNRFETREHFLNLADVIPDLDAARDRIDNVCDRSFCIVMGHNKTHDRRALEMLLPSHADYIGVLGPRHRTVSIAEEIGMRADDFFRDPRVHAPIGLDLGAETPEEIALSIAAEMLACARRATKSELKTLQTIHRTRQ